MAAVGSGVTSSRSSYFQNYQATAYPYSSMQPPQYMASSYTSPSYVGPYDRLVALIYHTNYSSRERFMNKLRKVKKKMTGFPRGL